MQHGRHLRFLVSNMIFFYGCFLCINIISKNVAIQITTISYLLIGIHQPEVFDIVFTVMPFAHTHKPIWLLSMYLFMLMILTSNKTNNGKSPLISFYTLLQLSDLNKSFKTVWCSFPKNHQLILKSFGSKFFGFFSFPKLKFHFIALMIYVLP